MAEFIAVWGGWISAGVIGAFALINRWLDHRRDLNKLKVENQWVARQKAYELRFEAYQGYLDRDQELGAELITTHWHPDVVKLLNLAEGTEAQNAAAEQLRHFNIHLLKAQFNLTRLELVASPAVLDLAKKRKSVLHEVVGAAGQLARALEKDDHDAILAAHKEYNAIMEGSAEGAGVEELSLQMWKDLSIDSLVTLFSEESIGDSAHDAV